LVGKRGFGTIAQRGGYIVIGETVEGLDTNSHQEVNIIGGQGAIGNYNPPVGKRAVVEATITYIVFGGNTFMEMKLIDNDAGGSNVVLHRSAVIGSFDYRFSMQRNMSMTFDADGVGDDGELEVMLKITELPI